jgi:hypothetical protein
MIRRNIETDVHLRAVCASMAQFPKPFSVAIGQPVKTRDQEAKFHAMLGEIAEQAKHIGSKWDADSWKRLIVDLWSRNDSESPSARVIPALDSAGIVQLGIQTRALTKERYGSLISFTQAWCAENGVELSESTLKGTT